MKMSCSFFSSSQLLVVLPLLLVFSATLAFGATRLPEDEVEALKDVAKSLRKTNWNFSEDIDPCGSAYGWANLNPVEGFEDAVTCNCSSVPNSTVCHVTSMYASLTLRQLYIYIRFAGTEPVIESGLG
ncbi:PREDICTED: probable leucine-rich repeat receptor-like serine/threonine-protein kinase At3g14840-like [Fragaria vesca subsp. vesca]